MQKILLFSFLLLTVSIVDAQDSAQFKAIDTLVQKINSAGFTPQRDTLKQDMPDYGLFMKTYISMLMDGKMLMKYDQKVHSETKAQGKTEMMDVTNTFYFKNSQLIKVDESATDGKEMQHFSWYFIDGKALNPAPPTSKGSRTSELLIMAKAMVNRIEAK